MGGLITTTVLHNFRQRLQGLTEEVQALENRQKAIYKDQAEAETALKEQKKIEQRFQELTVQFQFVSELAQLQTQRQVLQEKRDELVRIIGNAEQQQSPEAIRRNIAKISKEQTELHQQLASLNDNLYLQLQKLLPTDSFELLTRLLAKSVLSLPVTESSAVELNDTAPSGHSPQNWKTFGGNRLELPGLSLDLSSLEPNLTIKTAQELETEIGDCAQQLTEWKSLLQTVESLTQQKQQQNELERQIEELDKDIKNYEELLLLQAGAQKDCKQ